MKRWILSPALFNHPPTVQGMGGWGRRGVKDVQHFCWPIGIPHSILSISEAHKWGHRTADHLPPPLQSSQTHAGDMSLQSMTPRPQGTCSHYPCACWLCPQASRGAMRPQSMLILGMPPGWQGTWVLWEVHLCVRTSHLVCTHGRGHSGPDLH